MMNEKPLITVIIPIYNVESYLEQSIRSVLAQSYKNFELILVDDGSNDGSGKIVDQMAELDGRIIPVHQRNQGSAAARNAGLERSHGRYAAFLDGDDWYHPDYLHQMQLEIKEDNCQLVSCCFEAVGVDHPPQVRQLKAGYINREEAVQRLMGYNSFNGYVWNKLFDLRLIQEHNIRFRSDYPACEDTMFVGEYLYYCKRIRVTEHILYYYRQVRGGLNRGRYAGKVVYDPKWMSVFKMTEYMMNLYGDKAVYTACRLHEVREAGIVLRSMEAAGYHGEDFFRLKGILRRGACLFFRDKNSGRFQKISVLLSCISPRLELNVWKWINRK